MGKDALNSVLGPVDETELKWIAPHEHLLSCSSSSLPEPVIPLEHQEDQEALLARYREAVREGPSVWLGRYHPGQVEWARRQITPMLRQLAALGVNGLVEATPVGIGRDLDYIESVRAISRDSGVHIFLTTGLYVAVAWPQWTRDWTVSRLADLFIKELEVGIADSGVRASMIKAGVMAPFTVEQEKALTAAAIAHRSTGASIHVHSHDCRRETVDLLTGLGVNPRRIYLAHADMNTSEAEFLWLAERGVRLVTTHWDCPYLMDQEEAYRLLRLLIARGYLNCLLVSIDFGFTLYDRWFVGMATWDNPDRTSYAYLVTHVVPKLRAAGIVEDQMQRIMRDNPLEMLRRG